MPEKKKSLWKRLDLMSEDIQIGGDINFRSMAMVAVLQRSAGLKPEQKKDMERLLSRANRLLRDLCAFWDRHPDLEKIVDRSKVAASDAKAIAKLNGSEEE